MNILLVCDYSLLYLGGAQTAVLAQMRALREAGHSVVLVAPGGEGAAHEWIHAAVTIPGVGLPVVRNTATLRTRLLGVLRRHHIDVVHLHSELGIAAAAQDVARMAGIPVVQTVHTFFWRASVPRWLQWATGSAISAFHAWLTGIPTAESGAVEGDAPAVALKRMTLAVALRSTIVISPSSHQARLLQAAGVRDVSVVVNTAGSAAPVTALTTVTGPLRVLWVGRCVPEKRFLIFAKACALALAGLAPGSLEVEIVGDGSERAAAERVLRDHPAVVFSGRLDSAEVRRRIIGADLVALTSSGFDNQPMTVAEAIGCSRGVLYVDPRLREGLDVAGWLTEDDTAEAIAGALVFLARNTGEVVELSRRAAGVQHLFSAERFVAEVTRVYRSAEVARFGLGRHPQHFEAVSDQVGHAFR